MKNCKLLLIVLPIIVLFQSCMSDEDIIRKMVKEQITSNLYNPRSYKETNLNIQEVNSTDGSMDYIINLLKVADMLPNVCEMLDQAENYINYDNTFQGVTIPEINDIDCADKSLTSYNSITSKSQEVLEKKLRKKINVIEKLMKDAIREYNAPFDKKQFAGYLIAVDYTACNLKGNDVPGVGLFVTDSDINGFLYSKTFDFLEWAKAMNDKNQTYLEMVMEYIKDYSDEDFDVEEFITYMSLN